ncbi:MAG: hypothetical protein P4L45_07205 [Ignavibacteriaceae bacterium]|jgi:hypothetical protein|nr:hypothetical protein [Ignavibacteriaceae bacterium]
MLIKPIEIKKKVKRVPVPQKPPKIEPAKKAYSRSKEKNALRKGKDAG